MTSTHSISLREKVEDLLLNQALNKADIMRIVKISKITLDKILADDNPTVTDDQATKINTLYKRLKGFESQIEEHIPPLVYNRNMQSDLDLDHYRSDKKPTIETPET